MTLDEFQTHIRDRYAEHDAKRGIAVTFMWFMEEVGELATALQGSDAANKEEELADVLAWLCTLANLAGVDLTKAVHDKYFRNGGPQGCK